jgi:DNA modification methylase
VKVILGEQIQYTDIWANDNYLQFMYERLLLLKELLSEDGSLYLHCDYRRAHFLRCLMDEVFGSDYLRNHVVWQRIYAHNDPGQYGHNIDHILYYVKSKDAPFNTPYVPYSQEYLDNFYKYIEDGTGRRYRLVTMTSPHPRPNLMYEWKGYPYPEKGWRYTKEAMKKLDAEGRLHYPSNPKGRIHQKYYLDEMPGAPAQELWTDINSLAAQSDEREDYPTQKPEALIERIINSATNDGEIVLDCFIGSGTTAAVAQKLGRRWIGADINKGAIQTTIKRLQGVIQEQVEKAKNEKQKLPGMEGEDETPVPAQLGFSVYRVNDYDCKSSTTKPSTWRSSTWG